VEQPIVADTLHGEIPSTCHRDDYAPLPSNQFITSGGLNSTTRMLFTGSPKATKQLPGYCGHIPQNLRNPYKLKHCSGEDQPRPQHYDLRLTKPGIDFLPGYGGMFLTSCYVYPDAVVRNVFSSL
jgi:hypothetical protein